MLTALARVVVLRPKAVLLAWGLVLLLAAAAALGGVFGQRIDERLGTGELVVPGPSLDADRLLEGTNPDGPAVLLILKGVHLTTRVNTGGAFYSAPRVSAQLDRVRARLLQVDGVRRVDDPFRHGSVVRYDEDSAPYLADDLGSLLVVVTLRKDLPAEAADRVTREVTAVLDTVAPRLPGTTGLVGSEAELVETVTHMTESDIRTGEVVALPVSLLIMVFVFAGLLAASLPIAGALASIVSALGALLAFSYVMDLDPVVVNIVTVMGLGLCIDYGLLLVSRYREEVRRRVGDSSAGEGAAVAPAAVRAAALEATLASAGRTVLFSGLTIAIALSGLLVFRTTLLRAMGAAGISTVVVAMVVALTLVPALIVIAGPRVLRPSPVRRLPLIGPAMRAFGEVAPAEGAFSRLCRLTQRFPALTVWIVLAVLLVAALPVLRMDIVNSAAGHLPKGQEQRELFQELQQDFGFAAVPPITILAAAPPDGVGGLVRAVEAIPGVIRVDPPRQQSDGWRTVTVLPVRVAASDASNGAADVVGRIRGLNPPFTIWLTGQSVVTVDYVADLRGRAWLAAGVVVLATFALLFLMTGSVLVPVKALLMNVVSLGATLGIVVWGFQDGALEGLLRFSSVGGVETFVPPIVLAFGFGLAMDYEVFLLARIAENRERGASNGDAVAAGLQGSGRIISSAALILVVVFVGLLTGRVLMVKETGLALAASVVVDASLVRMLLVPATMTLLGEWNWWAPPSMRRWHERFGIREGGGAGEPEPPAEPDRAPENGRRTAPEPVAAALNARHRA